jgi:hypothetical protein
MGYKNKTKRKMATDTISQTLINAYVGIEIEAIDLVLFFAKNVLQWLPSSTSCIRREEAVMINTRLALPINIPDYDDYSKWLWEFPVLPLLQKQVGRKYAHSITEYPISMSHCMTFPIFGHCMSLYMNKNELLKEEDIEIVKNKVRHRLNIYGIAKPVKLYLYKDAF